MNGRAVYNGGRRFGTGRQPRDEMNGSRIHAVMPLRREVSLSIEYEGRMKFFEPSTSGAEEISVGDVTSTQVVVATSQLTRLLFVGNPFRWPPELIFATCCHLKTKFHSLVVWDPCYDQSFFWRSSTCTYPQNPSLLFCTKRI